MSCDFAPFRNACSIDSADFSTEETAYFNPAVTSGTPRLWIVSDEMGISKQEVKDSSEACHITDEFAHFNEKVSACSSLLNMRHTLWDIIFVSYPRSLLT